MADQKSLTLETQSKWKPKYHLKRIGEEPIVISQKTRDAILLQLANNGKFVQIGEYTIMLNAIKSIDPIFGDKNIPPKPKKYKIVDQFRDVEKNVVIQKEEINPEYEIWMERYGSLEERERFE